MNNIHYEAITSSPCNCLLMRIWFVYKSAASFSYTPVLFLHKGLYVC
jgi:hypothetical protein